MKNTPPLKIMFIASEAAPYAKSGGLGDVVGALPLFLQKMKLDVRIALPNYSGVSEKAEKLSGKKVEQLNIVPSVEMGINGTSRFGVLRTCLPDSTVPVYLIDHQYYFNRKGLYGEIPDAEYGDNGERFLFFSKSVFSLCKEINFQPDIIHAHDWHTGPVAMFLNHYRTYDSFFKSTKSLFTIHNMQYQGNFPAETFSLTGLGNHSFSEQNGEHFGSFNFLKSGIRNASRVNTVSEGYAREICTPQFGYGLDRELLLRGNTFSGIRNGIDSQEWDPEHDKLIPFNFDSANLAGKANNKTALQKKFNLPVDPKIPLFGIVTRLAEQKGIDVLASALPEMLKWEMQFVLLGTGESWAEKYFPVLADRMPEKCSVKIGYDEPTAHLIEAGCDFYIMPSRFEPCGLNQMYSLRYGTVPIVRATGGLDDSVENFNEAQGTGTGFKFTDLTKDALINTVGWALYTWYNAFEEYSAMQKRGMALDNSWPNSAAKYLQLYRAALEDV
ncbi:MAG: glycogen synthase GlgA [Leptospiraceae bacterium]|nr:glycogen synthase GlgA [Leptospiraceae bacterium]